MYLVIAQTVARPERRQDLANLLTQIAAASRQEPGCLSYHFTSDIEDEMKFSSIEVWDDESALAAHLAAPELAEALGTIADLVTSAPTITGYQVAGEPKRWA